MKDSLHMRDVRLKIIAAENIFSTPRNFFNCYRKMLMLQPWKAM